MPESSAEQTPRVALERYNVEASAGSLAIELAADFGDLAIPAQELSHVTRYFEGEGEGPEYVGMASALAARLYAAGESMTALYGGNGLDDLVADEIADTLASINRVADLAEGQAMILDALGTGSDIRPVTVDELRTLREALDELHGKGYSDDDQEEYDDQGFGDDSDEEADADEEMRNRSTHMGADDDGLGLVFMSNPAPAGAASDEELEDSDEELVRSRELAEEFDFDL